MKTPEEWQKLAESWRFEHFFLVWDKTHPEDWGPVFEVLVQTIDEWTMGSWPTSHGGPLI